ncbi:hypothetical protein [Streptosporangium sp. OZ121]|uniref:hypothetical protein n=1 Tax=unclassified Streptosporangium TaxID=2632669 RepID=UPI003F7B1ACE
MNDGRPAHPEPTRPETTIPGWRLILSDAGRLWASREEPFSPAACDAGAERTVDGDSLEALRAEADRQEALALEAQEREAQDREVQDRAAREQETLAPQEQAPPEQARQEHAPQEQAEQAEQVIM